MCLTTTNILKQVGNKCFYNVKLRNKKWIAYWWSNHFCATWKLRIQKGCKLQKDIPMQITENRLSERPTKKSEDDLLDRVESGSI